MKAIAATRRRFFAFAGSAPLAVKAAADQAINQMSGVASGGFGGLGGGAGAPASSPEISSTQYRLALSNKITRRMVEDIIYEEQCYVSYIDVDLASYKSFSPAARVAFQRQRNVERRLIELQNDYSWMRLNGIVKKALGLFGG